MLGQNLRAADLYDFVTGEGKQRDVCGIAGHEIAVEHPQDAFMRDDKEVVLFSLEFENDGFKADGYVVVGLRSDQHHVF